MVFNRQMKSFRVKMDIKPVSEVLSDGLGVPTLNALIPNEDNYTVLVLQPHGDIEASTEGVQNRNRDLAFSQFSKFLDDANDSQSDLVITPEYSMPWDILTAAIREHKGPSPGKLWALGCESIRISELEALKESLAPFATVIYEPLDAGSTRFVSPLAYVFVTPSTTHNGEAQTVLLVQFKTHAMGDPDHFEINGMQRGTCVYQFGGGKHTLRLVSLICADAFAFEDAHAREIYDRALILHIQLNQNPRNKWFLGCRDRLLRWNGDATEVLCLNWSANVTMWIGGEAKSWNNIAGSAWYLKSGEFDDRDTTLCNNHRQGLYYTWLQPSRSHALFFNYNPASYLLTATKVAHIAVAGPVSRRRGPQLTLTRIWNNSESDWVELAAAEDGFSTVVGESDNARNEIKRIADGNPLEAERILALCAGEVNYNENWHKVQILDSCVIDSSEVVRRVTFAQDTHEQAVRFRTARLQRCGRLWDILRLQDLPPSLLDLKYEFNFQWAENSPHQNIISKNRKRATVIYMGEECNATQIEATEKHVANFLHKSSSDIDQSRLAQQRLHIWFRDVSGAIVLYKSHRYVKFDQTGDKSQFDIGRDE
jgi:hypothetical protein